MIWIDSVFASSFITPNSIIAILTPPQADGKPFIPAFPAFLRLFGIDPHIKRLSPHILVNDVFGKRGVV